MNYLGTIIKNEREKRSLLLRRVGAALDVDQALISKYERGERIPTKQRVALLAKYYELNQNDLMIAWLADRILNEVKNEKMGLKAMQLAEKAIKKNK